MIHWKREGHPVQQGLSVYHPKDRSSIGGVLRIGNHLWGVRYSRFAKQWFISHYRINPTVLIDYHSSIMETDIELLEEQLKTETDPLVIWRIEKQIELLEDAMVSLHEHRPEDKG